MRSPAHALALAVALALVAGCAEEVDPRADLVPYPRIGDVAIYQATGALVDLSRWENGHPFSTSNAQVRFTVTEAQPLLDAARAVHPTFRVAVEIGEAGGFVKHSDLYVSPDHQGLIQAHYPLSQDQSLLSFDERGFPWLWGASGLFGEQLEVGEAYPLTLPDNLGTGVVADLAWIAQRDGDGWRLTLDGEGANATIEMRRGSPWPARVAMTLDGTTLAPNVRIDGQGPATIEATLVSVSEGDKPVPPRDRGQRFVQDEAALRMPWDGEKPPDGPTPLVLYPLSEAVRDAKLLDRGVQAWLQTASEPKLYRGSYQVEAGPVEGSTSALWLLQWVDRSEAYYEVQVSKLSSPQLPVGVPRIESSNPAEPPGNEAQGWFASSDVPQEIVPLGEGIRIMQDVFGAPEVQVFLRSFAEPPGYSYFLDGGWEVGKRYTVVYNPNTGLLEEATGPVTPRGPP